MDTEKDAIAILHDAERSLRGLMQARLTEQRYNDVASIARLADGLSQLLQCGPDSPSPRGRGQGEGDPPMPIVTRSARLATAAPPRKPKATPKKKEYPRFVREGDRLVKIGWSKKNKTTYEHRVPHEVVISFVRHLRSNVPDQALFRVDDLLPVSDIASGEEIPAYQVYLVLAWLRYMGSVTKGGRDTYSMSHARIDDESIGRYWSAIPAI